MSFSNQRANGDDQGDGHHRRPLIPLPVGEDEQINEESTATPSDDCSSRNLNQPLSLFGMTSQMSFGHIPNHIPNPRRAPVDPEVQRRLLVSILEDAMRICNEDDITLSNRVRNRTMYPPSMNSRRTLSPSSTDDSSKHKALQ